VQRRPGRELQLAKAAIGAAVKTVSNVFGIEPEERDTALPAGGFGNFIRRSSAKRIGLLPNMPSERIESIGNAALVGAGCALTCRCCRRQAQSLSDNIAYVELAGRQDFQQYYMEGKSSVNPVTSPPYPAPVERKIPQLRERQLRITNYELRMERRNGKAEFWILSSVFGVSPERPRRACPGGAKDSQLRTRRPERDRPRRPCAGGAKDSSATGTAITNYEL